MTYLAQPGVSCQPRAPTNITMSLTFESKSLKITVYRVTEQVQRSDVTSSCYRAQKYALEMLMHLLGRRLTWG